SGARYLPGVLPDRGSRPAGNGEDHHCPPGVVHRLRIPVGASGGAAAYRAGHKKAPAPSGGTGAFCVVPCLIRDSGTAYFSSVAREVTILPVVLFFIEIR